MMPFPGMPRFFTKPLFRSNPNRYDFTNEKHIRPDQRIHLRWWINQIISIISISFFYYHDHYFILIHQPHRSPNPQPITPSHWALNQLHKIIKLSHPAPIFKNSNELLHRQLIPRCEPPKEIDHILHLMHPPCLRLKPRYHIVNVYPPLLLNIDIFEYQLGLFLRELGRDWWEHALALL